MRKHFICARRDSLDHSLDIALDECRFCLFAHLLFTRPRKLSPAWVCAYAHTECAHGKSRSEQTRWLELSVDCWRRQFVSDVKLNRSRSQGLGNCSRNTYCYVCCVSTELTLCGQHNDRRAGVMRERWWNLLTQVVMNGACEWKRYAAIRGGLGVRDVNSKINETIQRH